MYFYLKLLCFIKIKIRLFLLYFKRLIKLADHSISLIKLIRFVQNMIIFNSDKLKIYDE